MDGWSLAVQQTLTSFTTPLGVETMALRVGHCPSAGECSGDEGPGREASHGRAAL